ncbi:MAG: hypothetical protein JJU11_09795 [Candidatus Sumerlaeia bacterium]|nr:hypothetical protein [Candidatus Sumerlaeia bacterium]
MVHTITTVIAIHPNPKGNRWILVGLSIGLTPLVSLIRRDPKHQGYPDFFAEFLCERKQEIQMDSKINAQAVYLK